MRLYRIDSSNASSSSAYNYAFSQFGGSENVTVYVEGMLVDQCLVYSGAGKMCYYPCSFKMNSFCEFINKSKKKQ